MRSRERHDHLASSFTDLMSSLAVIFILLFLAFVHEQESRQGKEESRILKELEAILSPAHLGDKNIIQDGDSVVVIVPEGMTFVTGKADLNEKGKDFLSEYIPKISTMLLAKYKRDVDSIVVEGYTDRQRQQGESAKDGQKDNLQLSQRRSMAVVIAALDDLDTKDYQNERNFFMDRLSATGRGEEGAIRAGDQDNAPDPRWRCVELRIRVRATALQDATETIRTGLK